jgi:hypothetical protein
MDSSERIKRLFWPVLLLLGGVLAVYGYLTIGIDPHRETSGIMPILLGLVPPLVAGAVVRASSATLRWFPVRWVSATIAYLMAAVVCVIAGHYLLPELIPGPLGCCPL